ncbi:hypothetical protein BATDEDRAFT_34372 [Batrachochytrium dendrobatidis JAM81]|uniref:PH domain-containing protein n=2 Tax=Batrachochytrium dendrobatidis TaxID=109871 RepID=F4NXF1_BATDJ|nr:uncharacterized protein BATDEDRAFT_34372 [Batrachochytrium dendrobatidis JAM81]EGF82670.1 hypothetical protein BATDEDRAFT_34372 [Batrachochytrium dendrobatidis JAM81]OAJ39910.1 hypothetical protein BDEG_23707 [Batrachochytrium dendrobatidis JEL423]|eukprot:XP_006676778.1 hypothetical protein BATDEDRAFT_34372 [Batrachochytrium dendrobatidis JAM81]
MEDISRLQRRSAVSSSPFLSSHPPSVPSSVDTKPTNLVSSTVSLSSDYARTTLSSPTLSKLMLASSHAALANSSVSLASTPPAPTRTGGRVSGIVSGFDVQVAASSAEPHQSPSLRRIASTTAKGSSIKTPLRASTTNSISHAATDDHTVCGAIPNIDSKPLSGQSKMEQLAYDVSKANIKQTELELGVIQSPTASIEKNPFLLANRPKTLTTPSMSTMTGSYAAAGQLKQASSMGSGGVPAVNTKLSVSSPTTLSNGKSNMAHTPSSPITLKENRFTGVKNHSANSKELAVKSASLVKNDPQVIETRPAVIAQKLNTAEQFKSTQSSSEDNEEPESYASVSTLAKRFSADGSKPPTVPAIIPLAIAGQSRLHKLNTPSTQSKNLLSSAITTHKTATTEAPTARVVQELKPTLRIDTLVVTDETSPTTNQPKKSLYEIVKDFNTEPDQETVLFVSNASKATTPIAALHSTSPTVSGNSVRSMFSSANQLSTTSVTGSNEKTCSATVVRKNIPRNPAFLVGKETVRKLSSSKMDFKSAKTVYPTATEISKSCHSVDDGVEDDAKKCKADDNLQTSLVAAQKTAKFSSSQSKKNDLFTPFGKRSDSGAAFSSVLESNQDGAQESKCIKSVSHSSLYGSCNSNTSSVKPSYTPYGSDRAPISRSTSSISMLSFCSQDTDPRLESMFAKIQSRLKAVELNAVTNTHTTQQHHVVSPIESHFAKQSLLSLDSIPESFDTSNQYQVHDTQDDDGTTTPTISTRHLQNLTVEIPSQSIVDNSVYNASQNTVDMDSDNELELNDMKYCPPEQTHQHSFNTTLAKPSSFSRSHDSNSSLLEMPKIEIGSMFDDDSWLSGLVNTPLNNTLFSSAPTSATSDVAIESVDGNTTPVNSSTMSFKPKIVVNDDATRHQKNKELNASFSDSEILKTPLKTFQTVRDIQSPDLDTDDIIDSYLATEEVAEETLSPENVASFFPSKATSLHTADSIPVNPPIVVVPTNRKSSVIPRHVEPFFQTNVQANTKCQGKSKSVSFGVSWKGELETHWNIPPQDSSIDLNHGASGILLLKVEKLCNVGMNIDDERVVDIEFSHDKESITSPPLILESGETCVSAAWEDRMSLMANKPIEITVRVRKVEQDTGLTRSLSSRAFLSSTVKAAPARFFSKLAGLRTSLREPIGDMQQDMLQRRQSSPGFSSRESGSYSSLSSLKSSSSKSELCGFSGNGVFGKGNAVSQVAMGRCTISNPLEWSNTFSCSIADEHIPVYSIPSSVPQNNENHSFDNACIATIQLRVAFIPLEACAEPGLLPENLLEVESGIHTRMLYSKIWKEGYLHQEGGDLQRWKRRYFKLIGDRLVGYNEFSREQSVTIKLSQLEAVRFCSGQYDTTVGVSPYVDDRIWTSSPIEHETGYNGTSVYDQQSLTDHYSDPDSPYVFALQFRDGRTIAFRIDVSNEQMRQMNGNDIESMRNDWMDAIEASHHFLTEHPVPSWLKN